MRTRPFTLLTEDEIKRLIYNGKELKVELSEEELKPLTGLDKFISCSFSLDSDFLDDRLLPVIKMTVYLECDIIDNVTFKKEHEVFFDTDDVVITSEDEEEEIERINKYYNLRPTFLAILYSLVPYSYTKTSGFKDQTYNGVEILSEKEYNEKRKAREKENSPFVTLDEKDFEN